MVFPQSNHKCKCLDLATGTGLCGQSTHPHTHSLHVSDEVYFIYMFVCLRMGYSPENHLSAWGCTPWCWLWQQLVLSSAWSMVHVFATHGYDHLGKWRAASVPVPQVHKYRQETTSYELLPHAYLNKKQTKKLTNIRNVCSNKCLVKCLINHWVCAVLNYSISYRTNEIPNRLGPLHITTTRVSCALAYRPINLTKPRSIIKFWS